MSRYYENPRFIGDLVIVGLYTLPWYLQGEYKHIFYVFDVVTSYFDLTALIDKNFSGITDSLGLLEILATRMHSKISFLHVKDKELIYSKQLAKYRQIHGSLGEKLQEIKLAILNNLRVLYGSADTFYEEIIRQKLTIMHQTL